MKKSSISELFVFAFITFFLIRCVPSAQSISIPLEIDDQKILLEFQQNDVNIPVIGNDDQWNVTLKPEPFALIVNGNKEIVSIMALKSADLVLPLQQSSKTLVKIPGTGNAFSQNDLYLINQPLEIYDLNIYTLQRLSYFSFSSEKATNTVNALKNQFGTELLALFSPRSYINTQPGQDQNYLIKTINGSAVQSGESIVLVVFVEKQSNDPFFSVLKWLVVKLVFE